MKPSPENRGLFFKACRTAGQALILGLLLLRPLHAAGEGGDPLDRALEAAARSRADVAVLLTEREARGCSPLFLDWMRAPLDAPEAAMSLAGRLLASAPDPSEWLSALPAIEGEEAAFAEVPVPGADWGLPPVLSLEARQAVSGILDAATAARALLGNTFREVTPEELLRMERRLFPEEAAFSLNDDPDLDPDRVEETRKALEAAGRVDRKALLRAGVLVVRAAWRAAGALEKDPTLGALEKPLEVRTALGLVRIGTSGADVHEGPALLVVDPGGDDLYRGRVASAGPDGCSVVIDLQGDDAYLGGDRTQGAGVRGVGVLLDLQGDDLYRAGSVSQGAGVFGVGLLVDVRGRDQYLGERFVQAAACWGYGGLLDLEGDDLYRCASEGQAYTWLRAAACLADACGNDRYVAGFERPDPRDPGMNQSFAQGFAMGYRGLGPGGSALLADGAGSDIYQGRYFAQGASYWKGAGLLVDISGRDTYTARRYAQGAGIHHSLGLLLDWSGDDTTTSWGVSQGCGHDLGVGVYLNHAGNDTYAADWLSLGGSEANGIGLFVDHLGADGYETRAGAGFGRLVPSRRSGGLGLFLDTDGRDRYSGKGHNDGLWSANRWGVGLDAEAGGRSGLRLSKPAEPAFACPDPAGSAREAEAARLRRILEASRAGTPALRVDGLLSVASHWGHEKDLPRLAREELLGLDPGVSLPVLIERLDTPDLLAWFTMSEVFTIHAARARPLLETQAASHGPLVRQRAIIALGLLKDARSLDVFVQALRDPRPEVRAAAARAVGDTLEQRRLGDLKPLAEALAHSLEGETAAPLADSLSSKEAVGKAMSVAVCCVPLAYEAYERFSHLDPSGSQGAVERFAAFLLDRGEVLRRVLEGWVQALQRAEESADGVRPLLRDTAPSVRASAAYALGQMEAETALSEILDRLEDERPEVRDAAALALVFFGDRAVEPLLRRMNPGDAGGCIVGLDILGRMGTRRAFEVLAGFLDHPDRAVRTAAEQAMGLTTP